MVDPRSDEMAKADLRIAYHIVTCKQCPIKTVKFLNWGSRFDWIKEHYQELGHTRYILNTGTLPIEAME